MFPIRHLRPRQKVNDKKRPDDEVANYCYRLEKELNFRWVAKSGIIKPSTYSLRSSDLVSDDLQRELAEIGQFSEVAYGIVRLSIIWQHLDSLMRPEYPLQMYDALRGSQLLDEMDGHCALVKGCVVYRPNKRQLVIAFSGTRNWCQVLQDLDVHKTRYKFKSELGDYKKAKVHAGFWRMYRGIRHSALSALSRALKRHLMIDEVVITGHSLGAALSVFFILNMLYPTSCPMYFKANPWDISRVSCFKLVLFGCPRIGNESFANLYKSAVSSYQTRNGPDKLKEFSVKLDSDGITAMPPISFGYRHAPLNQFYAHHGRLYKIPSTENEYSMFHVLHDEEGYASSSVLYPLGGHNYYNDRDMEELARRMRWIRNAKSGILVTDWENRFLDKLKRETEKVKRQ